VVVFSHYGLEPNNALWVPNSTHLGRIVGLFVMHSLSGAAAVIVFFVVSGLCIHLPYVEGQTLSIGSFYARRILRIVPPALVFYILLGRTTSIWYNPQQTVLWSILCEFVYYLIFPALLYLRRRTNWIVVLLGATACALALFIHHQRTAAQWPNSYTDLGWSTWVIGLPCWLLGCILAEHYAGFPTLSVPMVWIARLGILAFSIAIDIAKYSYAYDWTHPCVLLDLFSVGVFAWLGLEIAHFQRYKPWPWLEWAGSWSFSLYLVHTLIPHWAVVPHWLPYVEALLASYAFYRLIERPSHRLATRAGRSLLTHTAHMLA